MTPRPGVERRNPVARSGDADIIDVRLPSLTLRGSVSQAACFAGFVFTGAQTPHEPETGKLVTSADEMPAAVRRQVETGMLIADVPEARIRAQTWRALENLRLVLELAGSSLERLVHLRVFLRDMRDADSAIRVLSRLVDPLPSTSVVGATSVGVDEAIDVQVDAIAVMSDLRPVPVAVPDLAGLTAPFPAATRAGQLVFTTPVAGVDPGTDRLVTRIADLPADLRALASRPYGAREEVAVAQHLAMWANIRRILEAERIPFENVLHQNGWSRLSMRDFVPVAGVRRALFGTGAARTAATTFPVSGIRREDALFEYEVIAVAPGDGPAAWRKELNLASHGVGPYYLGAVKAGPFVFTAGEVPIDTSVPKHIDRAADLGDEMRLLPYGRIHREVPVMAQAHWVYKLLGEALVAYDCSPADVLQQTVYMVTPSDYPAVERIATLYYGPKLPPTTIVPILGTSPFPQAGLEIELVSAAPTSETKA